MASAEAATGAVPRSRRWPLPSARHVLVVELALAAAVANIAVLRGTDRANEVLVVVNEVAAGSPIGLDDLRVEAVAVGSETLGSLVDATALIGLDGLVATRTLSPGEPLLAGDTVSPLSGDVQRSMSIPVSYETAVGGALVPGDRVDVVGVFDDGARFLAQGLAVLAVPEDDGLGGTNFAPTVAVDPDTALAITQALEEGKVHLLRSTGAQPVEVPNG